MRILDYFGGLLVKRRRSASKRTDVQSTEEVGMSRTYATNTPNGKRFIISGVGLIALLICSLLVAWYWTSKHSGQAGLPDNINKVRTGTSTFDERTNQKNIETKAKEGIMPNNSSSREASDEGLAL